MKEDTQENTHSMLLKLPNELLYLILDQLPPEGVLKTTQTGSDLRARASHYFFCLYLKNLMHGDSENNDFLAFLQKQYTLGKFHDTWAVYLNELTFTLVGHEYCLVHPVFKKPYKEILDTLSDETALVDEIASVLKSKATNNPKLGALLLLQIITRSRAIPIENFIKSASHAKRLNSFVHNIARTSVQSGIIFFKYIDQFESFSSFSKYQTLSKIYQNTRYYNSHALKDYTMLRESNAEILWRIYNTASKFPQTLMLFLKNQKFLRFIFQHYPEALQCVLSSAFQFSLYFCQNIKNLRALQVDESILIHFIFEKASKCEAARREVLYNPQLLLGCFDRITLESQIDYLDVMFSILKTNQKTMQDALQHEYILYILKDAPVILNQNDGKVSRGLLNRSLSFLKQSVQEMGLSQKFQEIDRRIQEKQSMALYAHAGLNDSFNRQITLRCASPRS